MHSHNSLFVSNRIVRGLIAMVAMLMLSFGFSPTARAQVTGEISGTVADPSGAVVPEAKVLLRNLGTNAARTVTTDGAGLYSFTNLQPGHYEVSTTPGGFAPYKAIVLVEVGGRYTVNAKLQLSTSSTAVEVMSSESAQINTSTPEISQVITAEQVSQLPSLTRNPYDFVALSGNVSSGDSATSGYQNGPSTARGVGFNLNGSRQSGTEVLLDGIENISVFTDQVAIRVPLDSVQEYRIVTNNFLPEYGRASGGVVSVATKSGTNAFHGTAWEFNRLSATTANTVTNAQGGNPKGKYTRNQFGVEVAGPIVKDKLFFEGTVEWLRVRSAAVNIAAVPTPQLLAASPASVQSFFSTYSGPSSAKVIGTTTNIQAGTAGGGNTSLYSSLPNSLPIFNAVSYIAPGDAGGGPPENRYNVVGRVDYDLSQKTQTFFRYSDDHEIDQSGYAFSSPFSQYNVASSSIGQAYLLSLAHEFNAAFSTISKASFTRSNVSNLTYNTALQNTPTLIISPNAVDPYSSKPFQLPGFYDTNPANGGLPGGGPQNTIQYNQDVNWLKGRHSIQGGAQILYLQMNYGYGAYAQAIEQLGSSQSKGLQNFLTGNLYQFQVAVNPNGAVPCAKNAYTGVLTQTPGCTITLPATAPSFNRSDRYHDWAAYAQDQFKITPKFTFDYGVRYESFGVQHNNNQKLDANFYYGTGASLPAQIRSGQVLTVPNSPIHELWKPQYGTVSPRVGFAYDVFGTGKTSFRAGYGISYERNFGNITFNLIQNPPNYAVVVVSGGSVTNSNLGPLAGGSGSVPLPPASLRHVDQNIRTAQTQFASASIQQQVGPNSVVEISYNHSRGIHLYDIKNYNVPGSGNLYLGDPITVGGNSALTYLNSQFKNDNNRGSSGDSYYDGVNAQFNGRNLYHSGLSVIANYTFAHSLDDLSTAFSEDSAGNFELGYTNAFNPALDHASSDFDVRHRFVVAPIFDVPTFKDKPMLVRELIGGYEVTGILTMRTGTPFTFYDSTNNNSGYQVVRYNPATPVTHTLFKSIPAGAANTGNSYDLTHNVTLPVDVPFGNAALMGISDLGPYPSTMTSRNVFRGPGAYNLDCSISKKFPIHEDVNIELRAEGFDVTNHHNLYIQQGLNDAANYSGSPKIIGSKGGIGNSGGQNDERRFLQFAGKINF
ncbi:MAG: TonB-dependent receptor [Acidobacteriota bacterium]|nr:TonB-dependent receptor [Acidobacteriota bacterium]